MMKLLNMNSSSADTGKTHLGLNWLSGALWNPAVASVHMVSALGQTGLSATGTSPV